MAIAVLTTNETGANSLTDINANFNDLDTTKADLASPTFTGTPTLPTGTIAVTQSASDNSTKVATTAYVDDGIATATIQVDQLQIATVSISAAQIISMYTTPITILAAPGAGKINIIDQVICSFTYGGTQFTGGGDGMVIREETSATTVCAPFQAPQITGTSSLVNYPRITPMASTTAFVANKSYYITVLTTAFATGNGTMKLFIKYRTITL